MLKLTIETKDIQLGSQIETAYDKALEQTTIEQFETKLYFHLPETMIFGQGGSHYWISDKSTKQRLAIIYK